jgi:hypothetical protein
MNSTPIITVSDKLTPAWHQAFLEHLLPRVVTHARFRFRDLPAADFEEALAETTATALCFFVRLVDRGKNPILFALRIARIATLRVKAGRLLASSDRSRDPLSRFARQRHGFEVASLDDQSDQSGSSWREVLTENHKVTPAEIAASRIDFSAWLGGMTNRRRQIALSLAAGNQTAEVAREFHLSSGRVSQLRREFEASWNEFQRDVTETSSPSLPTAA